MMNYIYFSILVVFFVHSTRAIDSEEFGFSGEGSTKTNCSCGWTNRKVGRIIGGEEAGMHEFPLIAALVTPKFMIGFCGGTIITEYHVLTAAHCFVPMKGRELAVSVGEHDLDRKDETPYTQVIPVEKIIEHPGYNRLGQHNDIAIVVLKDKIQFNQQVGRACLPTKRFDLVGKQVVAAGWGRTTAEGSGSSILLKVTLDVQPLDYCKKSYSYMKTNPATQICTHTDKKDSCKGDSGGPLMYYDPESKRIFHVGIASFGKSCATKDGGVWTDVFAFSDWIQKTIAETHPEQKTCG
uniref:Venom S1 protease 8 n=1 Tax=Oncocephalus sp. TaxID=2944721 RepID=A0AB38ZEJ3_9HEMI